MAATHTPEQKIWAELYERFDPQKPAQDPNWRVEREYSPAREIVRELERPMGGHKRFMILETLPNLPDPLARLHVASLRAAGQDATQAIERLTGDPTTTEPWMSQPRELARAILREQLRSPA